MAEKTLGQIAKEAYGKEFLMSESWNAAATAVRQAVLEEAEQRLSGEIQHVTLGPAIEGKITQEQALALLNAQRAADLAVIRSMKGGSNG